MIALLSRRGTKFKQKVLCERRKVNTCLYPAPRSPHQKNKATLLHPNLILPTGAPFRPQIPKFYLVKLKSI